MANKYIVPLVFYFGGVIFSIFLIVSFVRQIKILDNPDLIPSLSFLAILKGEASTVEQVIIYILWPFVLLPIGLLLDTIMTRLILWLHKIITFKNCEYRVVLPVLEYHRTARSLLGRTVIPAFFSLALGFLLVNTYGDTAFYATGVALAANAKSYTLELVDLFSKFQATFVASILTLPLTYLICSPLWLLEDAGVTFFQRQQQERQSINIQGVARYFNNSLKGYVSLTTLIAFGTYIYEAIQEAMSLSRNYYAFLFVLSAISVPFLMIAMLIPASLLHEWRFPKQVPTFLEHLREKGMSDFSEDELPKYIPKSKLAGH